LNASPKDAGAKQSPPVTVSSGKAEEVPPDVKAFLLKLARDNVEAAVKGLPPVVPGDLPALTKENRGCFVTLTKHGGLRGCIGYIEPIKPLFDAVIDNAKNAALEDPRFAPVAPHELSDIRIEVSVLTKPEPIEYKGSDDLLNKIVAGVDGIILTKGYYQSTYLPQVWEQLPDKVQFLENLSVKGGMPPDGWKTANVKRYRAIHFQER
jgi:AmmeMemoRadiSam system protein A